ncbi:hypothetical protein [Streptomyces sp. NPDC000994]
MPTETVEVKVTVTAHAAAAVCMDADRLAAAVLTELHDRLQVFDRRSISEGSRDTSEPETGRQG